MKCRTIILLAVVTTVFGMGLAPARSADEKAKDTKKIAWIKSLDKAFKEAKKQKKILVVDFFATWCGPCKALDRQTFSDPRVTKLLGDSFVAAKIDVDTDRVGAAKHNIQAMPTLVFFSPAGEPIARFEGAQDFLPAERAIQTIKRVLKDDRAVGEIEKQFKAKPDDPDLALRLATIYVKRQRFTDAEKLLATVERFDNGKKAGSDTDRAGRQKRLRTAYAALGEGYVAANKAAAAVPILRKALAGVKGGNEATMLRVHLINALLMLEKKDQTQKVLKELLASKDAPPEIKQQARAILASAEKVAAVEHGVVLYAQFRGAEPGRYYMMERYEDEQARQAHAQAPEVRALFPPLMEHLSAALQVQPVEALCGPGR